MDNAKKKKKKIDVAISPVIEIVLLFSRSHCQNKIYQFFSTIRKKQLSLLFEYFSFFMIKNMRERLVIT